MEREHAGDGHRDPAAGREFLEDGHAENADAHHESDSVNGEAAFPLRFFIAILNEVLKAELTAINQYFLHSEMCENWGYMKMAKLMRKESIEEMQHAEKCMERILLLDGAPNMTDYFKINVGQNLKQQLENDLQLEYTAVKRLNDGIKTCVAVGDNGSRELLEKILLDEVKGN